LLAVYDPGLAAHLGEDPGERIGGERQERQAAPKRGAAAAPERRPAPPAAKVARDQVLNRQQQEKADRKARLAQVKQLIEQNRLPPCEGDQAYNFVDGSKIRRIAIDAAIRERLGRGEIAIVHHAGRYDWVPTAVAGRISERDEHAVIALVAETAAVPADDAYAGFAVPDDLIW